MKSFYIKSTTIIAAIVSVVITGCLKDEDFDNGSIQSTVGSEMPKLSIKLGLSKDHNEDIESNTKNIPDTTSIVESTDNPINGNEF